MLFLSSDGAERVSQALPAQDMALLNQLAVDHFGSGPGVRLFRSERLNQVLNRSGTLAEIASSRFGPNVRPVRAVLFDKTAKSNWAVGWHQDRTIAVRAKCDVRRFGPWSKKAGQHHVEPPFEIISGMLTVRVHLDPCHSGNAPLMIAPGSHRLGRIPTTEIEATVRNLGRAICEADAGDVWLYATPILHASEAAQEPTHRRVLQVDYSCDVLPGELEWLGIS